MRKVLVVLAAMLLASTALAGTNVVRSHVSAIVTPSATIDIAGLSARLTALYGNAAPSSYLGSEVCLGCHNGKDGFPSDKHNWKNTRHSQMLRRPLGQYTLQDGLGVIANQAHQTVDDFKVGVDLSTVGAFASYGANAPKLSYDAASDTYWMTVSALKCQVVATVAGSSDQDQRYLLRIPVTDTDTKLSKALYFAPVAYSRTQGWQPGNVLPVKTGWYDASYNPLYGASTVSSQLAGNSNLSSHTKSCVGCHVTGIRSISINAAGEAQFQGFYATLYNTNDPMYVDYNGDGNLLLTSIGCESCHGPGAQHVLGQGDPAKIVNPANLTGAQSAEICGRCHIRGKSVPAGTWAWPYHDDTGTDWIPMQKDAWTPLASFQGTGALNYWGDGVLPSNSRPWDQFVLSGHGKTTFGQNGSSEACSACHSLHNKRQTAQLTTSITDERSGLKIPTSPENDSLCLACHATHGPFAGVTKEQVAAFADNEEAIAKVVSTHANHPFAPERMMGLGNCIDCHMSATGGHTWFVTRPEDTITYATSGVKNAQGKYVGYPNACANSCHNNRVNLFGQGIDLAVDWTSPFETTLATTLKTYYGPGGTWWDTTPAP
ncbi:MAG: hypothetical protein LAO05_08295 [Acidobacteriia bacterium]|nr:hypothetical protein [Terriglobia bacterium]